MNAQPKVLITAPFSTEIADTIAGDCDLVIRPPEEEGLSLARGPHREYLAEARVLVTEIDLVDQETLDLAPHLELVVSCRAMPVNVDIPACTARGVSVKTTPGRNADVTADFAFALVLATVRQLSRSEEWFRGRNWSAEDVYYPYREFRGMALRGRTLGIVGGGAIGRRMAERARGFGMDRLIYDPFLDQEKLGDAGRLADLDTLMRNSDIVTIHAPLMESTIGLVGAREIALMKSTAFLINAGRAAIVDKDALHQALETRAIQGAGLDVFWEEPVPHDDPFMSLPNVTITPHIAGASDDVVTEHSRLAIAHIQEWLSASVTG